MKIRNLSNVNSYTKGTYYQNGTILINLSMRKFHKIYDEIKYPEIVYIFQIITEFKCSGGINKSLSSSLKLYHCYFLLFKLKISSILIVNLFSIIIASQMKGYTFDLFWEIFEEWSGLGGEDNDWR